ncbi:isochorismatase family protein [Halomonas huangheensis]|uniref:Isochorismatase-like domain-containing protein n=1 Tax=Halomonas huangheensis TaxID=1178482 RepID=W1NBN5_9GAMM|nr:isochorismatase family protein [Halomonas huangheensis]ALM52542.1 hydrolase [Halomonas huangheensis]ERL52954.1 hypothetical protein BJB45_16875 [Halomonas huangheensis]
MDTALLLIDVQQSFTQRDYWQPEETRGWCDAQRRLIDLAHTSGIPLVRIYHTEPASGTPFDPSHGLIRPLAGFDDPAQTTFYKTVHNAFTGTGLESWLRQRRIGKLWISGIRTEQCCETTTRVASDLGFVVDFVSEATLTFPMSRAGITWSADDIRARTELVLEKRFARIVDVSTLENESLAASSV